MRFFYCLLIGSSCALSASAEPCLENFKDDGSVFSGHTYKTWAVVPSSDRQRIFARIAAFTAEAGFTIVSSNVDAGFISASQSVSHGKGATVPLNVSMQPSPDSIGTRIAITYVTSAGQLSPEDSIKRHFCGTIAAAL